MKELIKETERRMKKVEKNLLEEFAKIRLGKANPVILEEVRVEYYGQHVPLNQVASISVVNPQTVIVEPWDKNIIKDVEKAIQQANLGLNPQLEGNIIKIFFPPLSEERRQELVKLVKKLTEERRISIRNIRRDAIEEIRKAEKDKKISEDESHRYQEEIQKLTDKYNEILSKHEKAKEKDILG
ncbi:MAG: ribosome recycling factor [Caldiserica bacterium]|nr:MAG: ribosome recycling factor [Caldisericota bacterium]